MCGVVENLVVVGEEVRWWREGSVAAGATEVVLADLGELRHPQVFRDFIK